MLRDRGGMDVVDDEVGSPTFAGDLAEALVALAAHKPAGLFHLTNEGSTSRFALAVAVAEAAGANAASVRPTTTEAFLARYPLPAKRPPNSTLANHRAAALGVTLRPWEDAVAEYVPALTAELGTGAE
jgi:dTDP-4-dehydrorhamnose reductase